MKGWSFLLVLVLLAILFVTTRERFSATATIKNPSTWDAAELTRIKAMVTPTSTLSDADIRRVVGGFWGAWDAATNRITLADVNTYLDTASNLGTKRNEYRDLLQKYYIDQGQSVFTAASGYSTGTESSSASSSSAAAEESAAPTEIERPSTSTQSLKQEIATTAGIPLTDTTSIAAFVTQVQTFYDSVYLPDKTAPTYTQIMGFADGVDTTLLPAGIQNNFKVHLATILQSYFTPASSVTAMDTGVRTGGADVTSSMGGTGGGEGGGDGGFGAGKNVQGPESGGKGSATSNTTGGLGMPRNLPVLYGGLQDFKSALPSSASLGSDPTAKYLPYSRVPGDQDLYPDPYRLGKYFSSSSYSDKDAPEPAPFLADFSKFLS